MQTWQKVALGCGGLVVLGALLTIVLIAGIAIGGALSGGGPSGAPRGAPGVEPPPRQYEQYGPVEEDTETVTVRVAGTEGLRFTGEIATLDGSRSVEGTVPEEYEARIETGRRDFDYVSAFFSRNLEDEGEGTLRAEIVSGGEVVEEAETSARAGSVNVNWSPNE